MMNYTETLDYLYNSLPVFQHVGGTAYKAGPENILALSQALDNPHRRFSSVHVAGTNGKGSVSHMLAAVLQAAGYRVGLYTSPHLKDFRERIRVNGSCIPTEQVVDFVARLRPEIDRVQASFFEVTTAMAFDHFAREQVDVAVVEVGMGGRLDATNIIRPRLSVITNISHDHGQFLGNTLEAIATEKAGIIKEMTPVVIGESVLESQLVFIARAKECSSPIVFADQTYSILEQTPGEQQTFRIENRLDGEQFTLSTDLQGGYQRKNILTALAALDLLNGPFPLSREAVRTGLQHVGESTGLMGRWQILAHHPLTVCDTGHNEGGLAEVMAQLSRQTARNRYLILGFVADKELERVLPLLPRDAHYLFTQASIPRALPAQELAAAAARVGLRGECLPTVSAALAHARRLATADDLIFIGGSTFIVAELELER